MRRTLLALTCRSADRTRRPDDRQDQRHAIAVEASGTVTITIEASDAENGMCGLSLNWGDGNKMPPKE